MLVNSLPDVTSNSILQFILQNLETLNLKPTPAACAKRPSFISGAFLSKATGASKVLIKRNECATVATKPAMPGDLNSLQKTLRQSRTLKVSFAPIFGGDPLQSVFCDSRRSAVMH